MPTYEIKAPDGKMLTFEGPEGSTPEQAEAYVKSNYKPETKPEGPLTAGQVAGQALTNIPSSAYEFGKATAQPFLHPIETAKSIGNLGMGLMEKAGIIGGHDEEAYVDAVKDFFVERYGGWENVKKTMAKDPVGFLADASVLLSGGGSLAARAPGIVGKVGEITAAAGRIADPINIAGKTAKYTAKGTAGLYGGLATGTGGKAIEEAALSGAKSLTEPSSGQAFRGQFLKREDMAAPVEMAQNAISKIIKERGEEYRTAIKGLDDKKVLGFDEINDAVAKSMEVGTFKGEVINPSTQEMRNAIWERVARWQTLPADQYHTPAGLDALKKSISDLRNEIGARDQFGRLTPSGVVAETIAKGIERTIEKAAPEYGKIMKAYSEASDIIENLQRELSLGRTANVDTGLKKLQSVLRNNVSTSYGRREQLAKTLVDHGAKDLLAALAGQQLSTLIPRGLASRVLQAGAVLMNLEHESLPGIAKAAGVLTGSSPAIAGGIAHGLGIAASPAYAISKRFPGATTKAGRAGYQTGRIQDYLRQKGMVQ